MSGYGGSERSSSINEASVELWKFWMKTSLRGKTGDNEECGENEKKLGNN